MMFCFYVLLVLAVFRGSPRLAAVSLCFAEDRVPFNCCSRSISVGGKLK